MIEKFFKLFGINIKKRIEETPAVFSMEASCPACSGTGKIKLGGVIRLDFPEAGDKK